MPVTNSFRWNRKPEDFEEFYGAEMQPFLNPAFTEDEEAQEIEPQVEPAIVNQLINIEKERQNSFSFWLKLMIGKIKGSPLRYRFKS